MFQNRMIVKRRLTMGKVRMYKFGEDPDRLPGGKYTGEINFIASHLTSVLWHATFFPTILVVQDTA